MAPEATPVAERKRLTLDEFRLIPEGPPHFEFEDGELIEMTAPAIRHQRISFQMTSAMDRYADDQGLGVVLQAVDVELPSINRTYIPDIILVSQTRQHIMGEDGIVHGAPDLVVEIVSRHGRGRDRLTKFNNYFRGGVEWYWIVDAEELTVEEFHAGAEGYVQVSGADLGEIFLSKALPGLEFNLKELVA